MNKKAETTVKMRVAELMKPRGMKAKLGKMLGFDRASISGMFKKPGELPVHYIKAVSELTGKSVEWILTGRETTESKSDAAPNNALEILAQASKDQSSYIRYLEAEISVLKEELAVYKKKAKT